MSHNEMGELKEKIEGLEAKVIKMEKYYNEVLDSLDESNFSPKFLNKLQGLANNTEN